MIAQATRGLLLLFATLAAAEARAQVLAQAPADNMEEIQVTATRRAQATTDVSAAVTVVGESAVSRAVPQVVTDLLRGQPGVFVQQTTPGQGIPIVRGLKGSEVLHLVDGIRLNNALFRNSPNQYPALIDANIVSRLEVVRGPASALYGSDAMGGVVQFVTKEPTFDGDIWSTTGTATLRYGSADSSLLTHVGGATGNQHLAFSGGITLQDVNDRESGGGQTQSPSGYRSHAASAQAVIRPDDRQEWRFWAQYLSQPRTPRFDELNAGFGQAQPASEIFNFEPNDRLFLHGRYRLTPSWLVDSLELHLAHQEITDGRRTRDTGSVDERREDNSSRLTAITAQADKRAGDRHHLTMGAEIYLDTVHSERTSTDITTGTSRVVTSRFPDASTLDSLALYLHDEIHVGPRFSLNAGARFSHFEIELPPADRGLGADISLSDTTGNAGAMVHLSDTVALVGNVGRGFRPPNIFDLGTLGARPGNRFNIANPALGPESVLTVDAGFKFNSGDLRGEIIAFHSDYSDKISSVPTGDVDAQGRDIVQSENVGEVKLWGVEMAGRWRTSARWLLSGTVNFTRGDETEAGAVQPADRVPPLNGRLAVLYEPDESFWLEAWAAFAASQNRLSSRDVGDPRINPDGTPGWVTLNAALRWQPFQRLEVGFGVSNLLDKSYREHGSGLDASGRSFNLRLTGHL